MYLTCSVPTRESLGMWVSYRLKEIELTERSAEDFARDAERRKGASETMSEIDRALAAHEGTTDDAIMRERGEKLRNAALKKLRKRYSFLFGDDENEYDDRAARIESVASKVAEAAEETASGVDAIRQRTLERLHINPLASSPPEKTDAGPK